VNPRPQRDLALINAAGFLRSLGIGLTGVVLGIYIFRLGLSSLAIGLVIAAGLAGSAVAMVGVSVVADRSPVSLSVKRYRRYRLGAVAKLAAAPDNGIHWHAKWHGHRSFGRLCS
jgi:MFS family permease